MHIHHTINYSVVDPLSWDKTIGVAYIQDKLPEIFNDIFRVRIFKVQQYNFEETIFSPISWTTPPPILMFLMHHSIVSSLVPGPSRGGGGGQGYIVSHLY